MLRQMDVPVRGHSSQLTDDQVARARARWEREKRTRATKQAAPATATKKRRAPAKAAKAPVEPPPPPPAPDADPVRRRRKAADVQAAAAEKAAADEVAAADAAREAQEVADAADAARQVQERDAAIATARELELAGQEAEESEAQEIRGAGGDHRGSEPSVASSQTSSAPGRQRPRPVTPGAPRPRAGSSTTGSFGPPRPIASAAPGGGVPAAPRREDKKPQSAPATADRGRRKKGKRGAVDQEAVDANISKTMATMRGAPQRRSSSDLRRGVREEMEAARAAEVERERKPCRVIEFISVSTRHTILKVRATHCMY